MRSPVEPSEAPGLHRSTSSFSSAEPIETDDGSEPPTPATLVATEPPERDDGEHQKENSFEDSFEYYTNQI